MRIAMVSAFWGPAYPTGSGIYAYEVARRLAEQGNEVHVYASSVGNFNETKYPDNLHVHVLRTYGVVWSMNPVANVFTELMRDDFDIVHVHSYIFFMSNMSALARIFKRFNHILHFHGGLNYCEAKKFHPWKVWAKEKVYDKTLGWFTVKMADKVLSVAKKQKAISDKKAGRFLTMTTRNRPCVVAVVPAYNEEKYIGKTIDEIKSSGLVDYIIVVDDSSKDRTYEIALKKDVIVLKHEENKGAGAAIKTGFKKALELKSDIIVIMAGDGQMPVSELPKFIEKCEEGYGLVIGNRFAECDPRDYGMPNIRYYRAKILAFMTYIATGKWIPDSQNGYTAFRRETLEKINIDTIYDRWDIHNDIISRCAVMDIPIALVPQKPKFLDDEGKRIHSKNKIFNI